MNNTIINIIKVKEDYNIYNTSSNSVYYNITEKNCEGIETVLLSGNIIEQSFITFSPTKDGEYLLTFTNQEDITKHIIISHYPALLNSFVKNIEELFCIENDCGCNDIEDINCIGKKAKQCLKYQNVLSESLFLFGLTRTLSPCIENYNLLFNALYDNLDSNRCSLFSYFCEGQLDNKIKGTYNYNPNFIKKQIALIYLLLYFYEKELTPTEKIYIDFLNNKYNYNVLKQCVSKTGIDILEVEQSFTLNYFNGCEDIPVCTLGCIISNELYQEYTDTFDLNQQLNGIYHTIIVKNTCSTPQLFVNKAIYTDNTFSVIVKANSSTNPTTINPGEELTLNIIYKGTKPVYSLIPVYFNNEGKNIALYNIVFRENIVVENTPPIIEDIVKVLENRTAYTFTIADFENHFTDVDGDTLDKIVLLGDTSRFTLDGIPYESGTIITKANITKLKYTPLDTDTNYDVLLQWKAYDSRGLSSE